MSASVSFNGSTLWSEAGTGVGRVRSQRTVPKTRWAFEALPRGNGVIAKDLGKDGARIAVEMDFAMDSSAINNLESTLAGYAGDVGTLQVPPGQSWQYCVLVDAMVTRGPAMRTTGGSIVYSVTVRAEFQQLRS